jgi:tetratricopeptide (TPR) repeat protein
MMEGNPEAALAAMDASDTEVFTGQYGMTPRAAYRAWALRAVGDEAGAMAALQEARATMEAMLPELEGDCRVHGALGGIYAGLGMREEAVQAANRAVELVPVDKDALIGAYNVLALARTYATLGEAENAVEQAEYLLSIPSSLTIPRLRMGPEWEPIRDHASFQALLEG